MGTGQNDPFVLQWCNGAAFQLIPHCTGCRGLTSKGVPVLMEFWGTPPKTLSFTKTMKERGLKRRESVKAAFKVLKDPCWNDSWENWINLTELDCRSLVKWAWRTLQLFTMWEGAQAPTGGALKMPEDSCSYVIQWYHFWWTPRGFLWEHATLKHPETSWNQGIGEVMSLQLGCALSSLCDPWA